MATRPTGSARGLSPRTSSRRWRRRCAVWRVSGRPARFGVDDCPFVASLSGSATADMAAMNDRAPAGFFEGVFDRTLTNLRSAWRDIALSARGVLARSPRPELSDDDLGRLREQMLNCLDGRGGEVTARARAADLGRTYLSLDADGRERFLRLLAGEFDVDRTAIDRCCAALADAAGPVA